MKFKITWLLGSSGEVKASGFITAETESEAIENWKKKYPSFSKAIVHKIERSL